MGILHIIIPSQYQVFSQIDLSIERHWPIWQKGKARCFRSRSAISTMKIKRCQLQLQPCPQLVTVYTNNYKQLELAVLRGNTPSILFAVRLPWWMEHVPPSSLPCPLSLPLPSSLPPSPFLLPVFCHLSPPTLSPGRGTEEKRPLESSASSKQLGGSINSCNLPAPAGASGQPF